MTNICAAIGLAQLEQIEEILTKKKQIACWYREGFNNSGFILQGESENVENSYWMCTVLIPEGMDRHALKLYLINVGIETRPMFYPIHTMPVYSQKYEKHPMAESLARRGINLPSYPGLSKEDVSEIVSSVKSYKDSF